jgi:hypothetical protein
MGASLVTVKLVLVADFKHVGKCSKGSPHKKDDESARRWGQAEAFEETRVGQARVDNHGQENNHNQRGSIVSWLSVAIWTQFVVIFRLCIRAGGGSHHTCSYCYCYCYVGSLPIES